VTLPARHFALNLLISNKKGLSRWRLNRCELIVTLRFDQWPQVSFLGAILVVLNFGNMVELIFNRFGCDKAKTLSKCLKWLASCRVASTGAIPASLVVSALFIGKLLNQPRVNQTLNVLPIVIADTFLKPVGVYFYVWFPLSLFDTPTSDFVQNN